MSMITLGQLISRHALPIKVTARHLDSPLSPASDAHVATSSPHPQIKNGPRDRGPFNNPLQIR
jgi:hypothetical protein